MDLRFTNRFTEELTADPVTDNHRRQVGGAFYSRVNPVVPPGPGLVAFSAEMVTELGLDAEVDVGQRSASDDFIAAFSGARPPAGADPFAMVYGGHQFGNWAGQLGDGRAIALGEVETPTGDHLALQLKGAGPTPFSRTADGMAVLRSSIREFLCSEAMHHLGVPTTRALSLMLTGDKVVRDMLYDGNPAPELGAVVCRVSPSFIRFGNFEIFASRGEIDELRQLADFTIRTHFPELVPDDDTIDRDVYVAWFGEIATRTARMVVEWMRVGFVHGVMNTDNMSIIGETIDYGPYGWLEDYDPAWTPNTTDRTHRRYRFGQQAGVAQWNLAQLGNALMALVEDVEPMQDALNGFVTTYETAYRSMMAAKLGLDVSLVDGDDLDELIVDLGEMLQLTETDMTIFFRRLSTIASGGQTATDDELVAPLMDAYYVPDQVTAEVKSTIAGWLRRWLDEIASSGHTDEERRAAMDAVNPLYVLRNYLAQLAIDAAEEGDPSIVWELLDTLRSPYIEQPGRERFAEKRPDWARTRVGCSMLSCSS